MSSRTLPGLGLNGFWSLGEDGWKDGMDSNLRVLSALVNGSFKDFVSSVPGSPADGDIYIINSGADSNKLAIYDVSAWVYLVPKTGALSYNEATAAYYTFDGDSWNALVTSASTDTDYQPSVRLALGPTEGNIDWETGGLLTYQGITLEDGDPVLLFDQDNPAENLIYLARSGTWDRRDGWANSDPISSGTVVPIDEGSFGGLIYQLITPNPIDIGTTELTWKNNSRVGRTNFAGVNKNGDYTLISTDNRRWIYANKAGNQTFTLPAFADVNLPATTEIVIQHLGTGTKTITADTGVKLNGTLAGSVTLDTIYTAYWLKKRSKDIWVAVPLGMSTAPYTDEKAQDAIAAAFAAGTQTGITITYNDSTNSFDFSVSSTYTDEQAMDTIAALLTAGSGISLSYNDAGDSLTIASTITQYTDEMAQDAIAAAFAAGTQTGITITYNDSTNSFDFSSTGSYSDEQAMDAVAAMLTAGSGITLSYNDAGDTLTVSSSITQYTDEMAQDALASAFAAGSHTGITITYTDASNKFDFASTITQYTDEMAQDAIAAAFAAGTQTGITITYNDSTNSFDFSSTGSYSDEQAQDALAAAFAAGSHTGLTITYTDASNKFDFTNTITQYTDEMAQDAVAAMLTAGSGITLSYNDASNTLTVSSSITQYTDEMAQDTVASMLTAGSGITLSYNDASNTLTVSSSITQYTDEMAQDTIAAMIAAGTQTGISFSYNDASNSLSATVTASGFTAASTTDILTGTDNTNGVTSLGLQALHKKGSDIASASSPTVGDGHYWHITGTTTMTGLTVTNDFAGRVFMFKFTGSLLLTHNGTSFILPGAENITTQAGDTAFFVSLGSGNYQCLHYSKNSGPWYSELGACFGGAGSVIASGAFLEYPIPFDCTITQATLIGNPSGSLTVDVYVCTYANYDGGSTHPVSGDKITASAPMAISSGTKYQDSTLTGWTKTLTKGSIIRFIVTGSPSAITQASAALTVKRN